jgi:molecular chaperone DnaJ/curved DNA-binding protein
VKVPPGVRTGSRIRISGEGEPGEGGGPKGDLYLVVKVRAHPLFERDGDNIKVEVAVPLRTAILGGEVEVPTLKGKVALKVLPETQNGRVFRLAGRGMPHLNGSAHGDLFARVKVVLPTKLSPEVRKLFENLPPD